MSANKILSYELAPSPATIFGCLLPAPWLGVVAGLLLAFGPASGAPDRYSPLVLAVTHVLVLGMLAPIMIGALFQLLPVVAGQAVPYSRKIAPFVALGSGSIALALSIAFLGGERKAFVWAIFIAVPLYGAVILSLAIAGCRILMPAKRDASLTTLRWIALPLFAVIILGITLAAGFAGWWLVDFGKLLSLHVMWGAIGWIAALVLGIASTVVPMFWQTPKPSVIWHRFVLFLLWLFLLLTSLSTFYEDAGVGPYLLNALAFAVMCLTTVALFVLWKAKRRFDPAWILWMGCAGSWFGSAALFLLLIFFESDLPPSLVVAMPWDIGVLALVGGAVFPVNAMLGKIIPFLVFLHLRRQIPVPLKVPTMQEVILPQHLRWQARLALLALLFLLLLPIAPAIFLPLAGCTFAASQMTIALLILRALFRYRHELKRVIFHR